jgi:hypothetical protein
MWGRVFKRVPAYLVERGLKAVPGFALTEGIRRMWHVIVSDRKARLELKGHTQGGRDRNLCLSDLEIKLIAISHCAVKRT